MTAFRAYAARRLQVEPSRLKNQSAAIHGNHTHGAAIAIMMSPERSWAEVRGWVTADRTIITPKQHLGVLLAEAGVWQHRRDLVKLADTLAEDLVWSYGDGAIVEAMHPGTEAPALTIAPDGSGRLVFFSTTSLNTTDPEPPQDLSLDAGGGGGGAGQLTYRDTVSFTADHQATLQRAYLASPP